MGAKRVMYWRQPAAQRTMKSYLALSEAVRAELNPTDSRVHRWSAEVSARRKNVNAEEGMFVSLTAAGVADEVFTCTLVDHPETSKETSSAPTAQPNERQVVVLRKEREVMEGTTRVKEYLARCKTHTVAHRSKVDGVGWWCGDYAVRIGRVENAQGTYAGLVCEVEYAPVRDVNVADALLAEYAEAIGECLRRAAGESAGAGALVHVNTGECVGAYGLGNVPFGDAHAAVAYVSTVMTMQSGGL